MSKTRHSSLVLNSNERQVAEKVKFTEVIKDFATSKAKKVVL
jgi:hypothetical protein